MQFTKSIRDLATKLDCSYQGSEATLARFVSSVTTDSRELTRGMLFIARRGAQLDGHTFIEEACIKGAAAICLEMAWTERSQPELDRIILRFPNVGFLIVSDSTRALGTIAQWYREELTFPVICITGSNGKTSTKEIVRLLLTRLVGRGTSSEKSFNNHVGLPCTILRADSKDQWLVLEAGMNHQGELDYLGSIAQPDIAVVLNVGPVHLEYFASVQCIAEAKCELLRHVRRDGTRAIFSDDPVLRLALEQVERECAVGTKRKTFGLSSSADCYATAIVAKGAAGSEFVIHYSGEMSAVRLPLPGDHNVLNALAAVLIVREAFPELLLSDLSSVLGEAKAAPMRFEISAVGKVRIINDAYNANPVSMRIGLSTLDQMSRGEKVGIVLGEMLELGPESEKFHRDIGSYLATLKIATLNNLRLVAIGNFSQTMVQAAREGGLSEAVSASNIEEVVNLVLSWVDQGITTIYFKASRQIELERIVHQLVQELTEIM